MRAAALALLILTSFGCSQRQVDARTPRIRVPRTGVEATYGRHVRNAVEAGDGNVRVREWRRSLARDPRDRDARLNLARHYSTSGYPDLAVEHYRVAATTWPDDAAIAILLARALRDSDAVAEARQALDGYTHTHPKASAEAWSWAGILADEAGDPAGGERAHRMAITLHNRSSALHNNLGYNLVLQGRREEASAEFRRALDFDGANALALSNLAATGAPGEAAELWKRIVDPASAHSNAGAALLERGDYEGARRELRKAIDLNGSHSAALTNMRLLEAVAEGDGTSSQAAVAQAGWRGVMRKLGVILLGPAEGTKKQTAAAGGNAVGAGTAN